MPRLLLFIATKKGYEVLKNIFLYDKSAIGLVTTFKESDVQASYSEEIEAFCKDNGIAFLKWSDIKNNLVENIITYKITEAIAIGWKYLIPLDINKYLRNNLIVFHDSLLPAYRGFTPTPTAVICNENRIGMSVIYAVDEVDQGPVILQKSFMLDSKMYIREIIDMQSELYKEAVIDLIKMINQNTISAVPQDENEASYSIWRDTEDCRIDWSMSSLEIYNLIRAVGYPYNGAFTFMGDEKLTVLKSEMVEDLNFVRRDCGKIWTLDPYGKPIVVCGKGMLILTEVIDERKEPMVFRNIRKRFK
jgi:Methionyl-tRNA formyltransferase